MRSQLPMGTPSSCNIQRSCEVVPDKKGEFYDSMSPSSCIRVANFSGYEKVANTYGISAAVCVHADAELVITSGHVGMDEDMNMKSDLREQMEFAFKVSLLRTCVNRSECNAMKNVFTLLTWKWREERGAVDPRPETWGDHGRDLASSLPSELIPCWWGGS